jgi:hypothetical protein
MFWGTDTNDTRNMQYVESVGCSKEKVCLTQSPLCYEHLESMVQ